MRPIYVMLFTLALVCVAVSGCASNGTDPEQVQKDLEAVRAYFEKNHPGKKWDTGPAAIDTEEVRTAYGRRRFYYVFSAPPPARRGGVAPSEEEIKATREAAAKFEREKLSLTVGIDPGGKITEYRKAEDFNQGLMKVQSDKDARTAAAAVLSLFVADEYRQRSVTAKEIAIRKDEHGWACTVEPEKESWRGQVFFDTSGRCPGLGVGRQHRGPYPP